MTLLKSSLFVICAGGERITRHSRIIVEAVTRVVIHYVFLDVVGVYWINGHQEDQEGIRLRNNVVQFC